MNIQAETYEPRIHDIRITEDEIIAFLVDGRTISFPLAWSRRLSEATSEQRQHFEIIGDGVGVHWPDIDEDISVQGMLHGIPAPRSKKEEAQIVLSSELFPTTERNRHIIGLLMVNLLFDF